jgi:HPt (histidine-containing phosphotransfer) domain-containing protein
MDFDDEILSSFIEDTREHLAGIEANLMDMERTDADSYPELVNTVFRAAHSIKGGAAFLGLDKVRDLAHKLENVLHMMRNGEMLPDQAVISALLGGFDLLKNLVEDTHHSNGRDISAAIAALSDLTTRNLSEETRELLTQAVDVPLPGGGLPISMDRLSLEQATQGGRYLYLVEYDLIHDVHARGKTPLDIISMMESSGLIVDCRMDLPSVGDLDAPPTNRIPFYLLYATIVEPDVVGYLFALDSSRIRVIDHQTLLGKKAVIPEPAPDVLTVSLALEGALDPDAMEALKPRVLGVLAKRANLSLDAGNAGPPGTAFVQFICAAARSFAASGLSLRLAAAPPGWAGLLEGLGFDSKTAETCGLAGPSPADGGR